MTDEQQPDPADFPGYRKLTDPNAVGPKVAAHNRRKLAASITNGTALGRLQLDMLTAFAEFEAERRAEMLAEGIDPDDDRDPLEYVRVIADEWADTEVDRERRAALLDRLADRLDTSEVRALRLAAEAAAAITPRLIARDAAAGVRPAATADDLGVSERYVYRVLSEQRAAHQAE
ncbi:hypothetical protein [Streptomyces sp. NPDC059631]|uniref:hypothetical protein n=1 Tax=unclassified Streptomyces TaxID=2593676 RepID=UPI0036A2C66D